MVTSLGQWQGGLHQRKTLVVQYFLRVKVQRVKLILTKERLLATGTTGNPRPPTNTLYDTHTNILPTNICITDGSPTTQNLRCFRCQSRSNLILELDSPFVFNSNRFPNSFTRYKTSKSQSP